MDTNELNSINNIPYCLIINPYSDYNGSMANCSFVDYINRAVGNEHMNLLVAECGDLYGLVNRLLRINSIYGKMSILIMSGHGDGTSIQLGSREFINIEDIVGNNAIKLFDKLGPIKVVLRSCKMSSKDFAKTLSAIGCTVFAAGSQIVDLIIDLRNNKVYFVNSDDEIILADVFENGSRITCPDNTKPF